MFDDDHVTCHTGEDVNLGENVDA